MPQLPEWPWPFPEPWQHPHIVSFTAEQDQVFLWNSARFGTFVTKLKIEMSDGSRFNGQLTLPPLLRQEFFSMSSLTLSRALTSADDGTGTWSIIATTADGKFTATLNINFTISPPVPAEGPPLFSGWPTSVTLADNAAAGTMVASGTLTDSDGTAFTGTVNVGSAPLTFTP